MPLQFPPLSAPNREENIKTRVHWMSDLFVFSISVCFEACRGVQLDGGAADHFNAALLAFLTEGSDTTVHLSKKKNSQM